MRLAASRGSVPLLLALASCPACVSTDDRVLVYRRPVEIHSRQLEDGRLESFRIDLSPDQQELTLVVRSNYEERRAVLGMRLEEITKELAQQRMLQPYDGLMVGQVERGGPADRAGILPGDVMLQLDGQRVVYLEQVEHLLGRVAAGKKVGVKVRRGGTNGDLLDLEIETGEKRVPVESTSTVRVPGTGPETRYVGAGLGTLPAEWTREIYGEPHPAVLVGGVFLGSPAWGAGLRTGQRILDVEKVRFTDAEELQRYFEQAGREEREVHVRVQDLDGAQRELLLEPCEYRGEVDVDIPLIFDLESGWTRTDWDLGLGILADYEGSYRERAHDRARTAYDYRSEFSILFGLFGLEKDPSGDSLQLLWLMHFDT